MVDLVCAMLRCAVQYGTAVAIGHKYEQAIDVWRQVRARMHPSLRFHNRKTYTLATLPCPSFVFW